MLIRGPRPILAFVALSLAAGACERTGHIDLIESAIEDSAEDLRINRGTESEVDVYSGISGPWIVVVVPPSGIDYDALARSGVRQEALDRLKVENARLRDGQYIVQIRRDAVLTRPIAVDLVRIDKQFILVGRETTHVVAKLKGARHDGKPTLVDVFTREPG